MAESRHGQYFTSFGPAVGAKSLKKIRQTIRGWNLTRRTDRSLEDIVRMCDPTLRGWLNYYGSFYKSEIYQALGHFDWLLSKWARRKYKRLRGSPWKA